MHRFGYATSLCFFLLLGCQSTAVTKNPEPPSSHQTQTSVVSHPAATVDGPKKKASPPSTPNSTDEAKSSKNYVEEHTEAQYQRALDNVSYLINVFDRYLKNSNDSDMVAINYKMEALNTAFSRVPKWHPSTEQEFKLYLRALNLDAWIAFWPAAKEKTDAPVDTSFRLIKTVDSITTKAVLRLVDIKKGFRNGKQTISDIMTMGNCVYPALLGKAIFSSGHVNEHRLNIAKKLIVKTAKYKCSDSLKPRVGPAGLFMYYAMYQPDKENINRLETLLKKKIPTSYQPLLYIGKAGAELVSEHYQSSLSHIEAARKLLNSHPHQNKDIRAEIEKLAETESDSIAHFDHQYLCVNRVKRRDSDDYQIVGSLVRIAEAYHAFWRGVAETKPQYEGEGKYRFISQYDVSVKVFEGKQTFEAIKKVTLPAAKSLAGGDLHQAASLMAKGADLVAQSYYIKEKNYKGQAEAGRAYINQGEAQLKQAIDEIKPKTNCGFQAIGYLKKMPLFSD